MLSMNLRSDLHVGLGVVGGHSFAFGIWLGIMYSRPTVIFVGVPRWSSIEAQTDAAGAW